MIELENISKTYNRGGVNETRLFENFNMTVENRDFVSIVGSNGSGKTSLLNIICGSVPIDAGKVKLNGEDITKMPEYKRCRKIGRVYQDPAAGTCPSLTIGQNMAIADNKGKHFGLSRGIDKKKLERYKSELSGLGLGLEDKTDAPVGALSGGQRQALALLMATLTPIDFLILDEHTAALDPKTAETVMALTDGIVRQKKLTALMVTHNLSYAVNYGDRLIMMHDGRIALDKRGEDKKKTEQSELLGMLNELSLS